MGKIEFNERYRFNESWFDIAIPTWTSLFKQWDRPVENVLEVGCYEGRATVWLCENVLKEVKVRYDIVDTFEGSLIEEGMEGSANRLREDANVIEDNFKHNISFFKNIEFNVHKGFSQQILAGMPQQETYDFIYIDASHRADDTLVDAYFAHKMLKKGGIIIFDDLGWKDPKDLHVVNSPELGIKVFNSFYGDLYDTVFQDYQIGFIKKI
tara:strand:+ start:167 stop:796 length:630 start_codon:yes stop_codon:yes gene_type:complete